MTGAEPPLPGPPPVLPPLGHINSKEKKTPNTHEQGRLWGRKSKMHSFVFAGQWDACYIVPGHCVSACCQKTPDLKTSGLKKKTFSCSPAARAAAVGSLLPCLLEDRGAEAQRSLRVPWCSVEAGWCWTVSWSSWDGGTCVLGCARETVINLQQRSRAGNWDW